MTETTFAMLSDIAYLYKIILRIVLFLFLWKVFYPMKFKDSILQIWRKKEFPTAVFLNALYWNLHSLSFLIANSMYQFIETKLMSGYEVETLLDMDYVYKSMAIGLLVMFMIYTMLFLAMILGIKKINGKGSSLNWVECMFLSVLNIVGWMFAQMIGKIMVVKIDTEVFLLFDERTELLWWIPLMAVLLYFGEMAVIYSHQKYVEKQQERELLFVENQQIKVMKQRLEDVESFYGNIRKVRHEMRNHMTNIKGLVASEKYEEVENYIHELDTSIQALEYHFSTGNPVTTKDTDNLIGHGIGLKNVKDVASRYYGDLDIKVNENIFKVTVLLQEKEDKNDANHNTND